MVPSLISAALVMLPSGFITVQLRPKDWITTLKHDQAMGLLAATGESIL
jgi:hypothetical protein